jgi:ssDNA-binding Zn-finger/Zn-ribbon topoisomerase 1
VTSPLPANWKKFNKGCLMELFSTQVLPWHQLSAEDHPYVHWSRDRLVSEIENYALELKESGWSPQEAEVEKVEEVPNCPQSQLKMVVRQNRLTGDEFFGCAAFPVCRGTLSIVQGQIQSQMPIPRTSKSASHQTPGRKTTMIDGTDEMDGHGYKRATRSPESASWDRVSTPSQVELSEEELEAIRKMRAQKSEMENKK